MGIAGRFTGQISEHIPGGTMGLVVSAISRVGSITTRPTSIAIIAALLFVANLLGRFPGVPNDDSNSQYAQALDRHFNDWHPPVMAWLWSMFRLLADGDGPMFSFHIACYWLGFGLIAVALSRIGRPLAAWGIIGVGLFPPFLMMNINILKDVGLAVTFLAGFAAVFWYRIQDQKIPLVVVAISAVLLFYGTLVRNNAVFGVVPLLAYLIDPQWLGRPWRLLVFSTPAAMLLVPVSSLFNHSILNATPVGIIRSLEIFDMAGIAFYSGDMSVFGPGNSFTRQDVDSCYTPILWDTLSPWGECRFFLESAGRIAGFARSRKAGPHGCHGGSAQSGAAELLGRIDHRASACICNASTGPFQLRDLFSRSAPPRRRRDAWRPSGRRRRTGTPHAARTAVPHGLRNIENTGV
ncbi:MAG TPA: hypothetical protein VNO18_09325, partial [Xanthobacteraceae bacterium]|nr:hypothetical protein [Xanthobacteraceae bacterium]